MFNKIRNSVKIAQNLQPVRRMNSGIEQMGAISRPEDTRTLQELNQTIDAYAQYIPEVHEFAQRIKNLPKKSIGTIADMLELSEKYALLPTNIDLKQINKTTGKSYREKLLSDMVEAGETNPEALELTNAVINNVDSNAAKYILAALSAGVLKMKEFAAHLSETAKIIPQIAKDTMQGGYLMDFSKEEKFISILKTLIHPATKPDKIAELRNISALCDKYPQDLSINVNTIVESDIPNAVIGENYKTLEKLLEMMGQKAENIDIAAFVTKNTNLY